MSDAIAKVGSQTAMGRLLGVSQMAVSRWQRGVTPLPPEHVLAIEAATGVSKHDLRPDIYPLELVGQLADARHLGTTMEPAR